MRHVGIVAVIAALLGGCASQSYNAPVVAPVHGRTVAHGALRTDVFRMLPAYAGGAACREPIQTIDVEMLEHPKEYIADSTSPALGTYRERWTVTMCGAQQDIFITFRARPEQTLISLSRKP